MTNKEALDILKDRKFAYEVVITRTASHENRHMAEEELKLINACIIALEHMRKRVDAIPVEWIEKVYCKEYGGLPLSISTMIETWREENESNINS